MRDHDLSLSIAFALGHQLALNVYAHDLVLVDDGNGGLVAETPEDLIPPAISISSKSESLAGSGTIAKATVEITIESHTGEDSSEVHSQRVTAVAELMSDMTALQAGFDEVGRVHLLGRPCPIETAPEVEQRAFLTVLTYRVGYRAV